MTHGLNAYANGVCRCDVCRQAWAGYIRTRRRSGMSPRRVSSHVSRTAYYPEKLPRIGVALTSLGAQILSWTERRTGKRADDIIERLLRLHAADLVFEEAEAAA